MEFTERNPRVNAVGYESLVWVRDDAGRELSCSLDDARSGVRSIHDLSEHERSSCLDVSGIVGTERW